MTLQGEVLLPGREITADALLLTAPISFWGGVNPRTGQIADVRHPQFEQNTSGRALLIPATVGSSSAAAILLELVHAGVAPAALILHEPDAILLLGLVVAKEMGYEIPTALRLHRDRFGELHDRTLEISRDGLIAYDPATSRRPGTTPSG